jgi:hypothetical protein
MNPKGLAAVIKIRLHGPAAGARRRFAADQSSDAGARGRPALAAYRDAGAWRSAAIKDESKGVSCSYKER